MNPRIPATRAKHRPHKPQASAHAARVLLVRHAQSTWNASGRWQGQSNPPLSALGRAQAAAAAMMLGTSTDTAPAVGSASDALDAIVASDLARARETAEIIAAEAGAGEVIVDAGLRERDVGLWQGLTATEIESRYPGALVDRCYPPGWESDESLLGRVLASLHRTAELVGRGNILAVSHTGVFYILDKYFNRRFKRIGNLCGRHLTVEADSILMGERAALVEDDRLKEVLTK